MELTTVTMPKETYEHLLSLGVVSESLQHPEDEMFKCRSTNSYYATLDGFISTTNIERIEKTAQYSCYSSKESAEEFEKLRKQLVIQFEFREVYEQILGLANATREFYPVFCTLTKKWRTVQSLNTYAPRVSMSKTVCDEFCSLANLGLIEGLING